MLDLTLDAACAIIDAALAEARSRKLAPLCVAVLDAGGHAVAMKRADGAANGRPQIALAKAASCLAMGFGGHELARRANNAPGFYAALGQVFAAGMLPVPGGVLIRNGEGRLLGAVGVSGDTADNDEVCAVAGVRSVGLHGHSGG